MSENGENYTAGQKIYTAAGSGGSDKSHLCLKIVTAVSHYAKPACLTPEVGAGRLQ